MTTSGAPGEKQATNPWPVGALRDMPGFNGGPSRLDVAYYHQEDNIRYTRTQYGVDYNSPADREDALNHLRVTTTKFMARDGHLNDYVEWILLEGGRL